MNLLPIPPGMETEAFVMDSGALRDVPELVRRCFQSRRPWIVADENTWKAAAAALYDILKSAGLDPHEPFIFPAVPMIHADNALTPRLTDAMPFDCVPVSVGGGKKTEGKGYESPEAAMEAYAAALAKHDVTGMLSTFAVETLAEKYDFAMLLKQREVYASAMQVYCPDNPYGRDLSVEAVRGNISSSLFQQYKNLVGYENNIELNGVMQAFNSSREAKSFADCFNDSELFQSVELVRIVEPDEVFRAFGADNLLERETNQKNIQMNTEIYGAEAMNEGCLELMIDGEKYWVFLRQVQYDGKWYNEGFHGMMPMILGIDVQVNLVDVKSIPEY